MLIKEETNYSFDTAAIAPGCFIRARYKSWVGYRNGLVSAVFPHKLAVIGLASLSAVPNYFTITSDEVVAGDWEISWSADFFSIHREGGEP